MSHPTTSVRIRRALTAALLSCALLAGATACGSGGGSGTVTASQNDDVSVAVAAFAEAEGAAAAADARAAAAEPTPSTSAERQKFAKTRFVANAGLAAGATYQWIIKPYKAGKFKKGAKGRTFALVKAGLAGAFAYNRLKAAVNNAKGDPLLSKAVAPLTAGIESLKGLGSKLRKGDANDADVTNFQNVIGGVKDAGQSAGAPVQDQVPSLSQLRG
ncbi:MULTISPECIES: hypothetical protein [unclassified Streptomyces]|uniref:hypothetical protein n=1 Tax=unclassified Streptomyces TaxID=2593676 RepID=UPI002E34CFD3|nr:MULTISPECIES: hypothetical protein [unclassified Streptomyces]WUC66641.1 hypothetical protein OG861_21790 [Streptomyces sp. NBC_00539]